MAFLRLRIIAARAGQALLIAPVLACVFLALLVFAASLPARPVALNLHTDRELFQYPRIQSFTGRKIDVGTECIGVSYGLPDGEASALSRAVRAPVFLDCPSLLAFLEEAKTGAVPAAPPQRFEYARYWHGYAALSRPLLTVIPYRDLRMLTFNAVVLLFAALAFRLAKDFSPRFALAALLPFYFVNYAGFLELWTKGVSWIVMLVAALYFAQARRPYEKDPLLAFFLLGAMTAYFDFLTTPLLVFGFPAAVYFFYLMRRPAPPDAKAQFAILALIGGFWLAGYAGLWLSKLAIAGILLGPDVWRDALETATFRLGGAYPSVKQALGAATAENFEAMKGLWGGLALIVFLILPFIKRERRAAARAFMRAAPVFALLAAAPFVWFEILSNHSQIHGLFTHSNLVLFFLPFSLILFGQTSLLLRNGVSAEPVTR